MHLRPPSECGLVDAHYLAVYRFATRESTVEFGCECTELIVSDGPFRHCIVYGGTKPSSLQRVPPCAHELHSLSLLCWQICRGVSACLR
jgi:hypothetical protein